MEVKYLFVLDPPMVKEALICMRGWYHDVEDRPLSPEIVTIEKVTT